MSVISFDLFRSRLAEEFGMPVERLEPSTRFRDDLGFDVLELHQLSLFMSQHAGNDISVALELTELTVGELYRQYAVAAALRG